MEQNCPDAQQERILSITDVENNMMMDFQEVTHLW
jgi:hypothetical protein